MPLPIVEHRPEFPIAAASTMSSNLALSLPDDGHVTPSIDGIDPDQIHRPQKVFRKSCDRCHASKLKCESNQRFGSCLRCQRGGVGCVYSAKRLSGRPPSKEGNGRRRAANFADDQSAASVSKSESHSTTGIMDFSGLSMSNLESLTTLLGDSESLLPGMDFSPEQRDSLMGSSMDEYEPGTTANTAHPTLHDLSTANDAPQPGSPPHSPSSKQAERITTLSSLADDLEAILSQAHTRCSDQNIMNCK